MALPRDMRLKVIGLLITFIEIPQLIMEN